MILITMLTKCKQKVFFCFSYVFLSIKETFTRKSAHCVN